MSPWSLIPLWVRIAIIAGIALSLFGAWEGFLYHERQLGVAQEKSKQLAKDLAQADIDLGVARKNADESERRLKAQQENQRVQNEELARARADAERNARAADELRRQAAGAARGWGEALRNSPSRADVEAAAVAIGVYADLLGRADARASKLAAFADSSRASGLKCERDYDSLTPAH